MSCVIALTRYFAVSQSGMAHDLSDICSGASDRCNAMKKLIYTLACVLMVSAISIPFAMARDQNWNSLQHRLAEEQRQQKEMAGSGALNRGRQTGGITAVPV